MYTRKQARELYKKDDLKGAYPAFCELTKSYPRDGVLLAAMAFLEIEVNSDLSKAEELLKEAHENGCPAGFYHRIYGDLFSKKNIYDQAVKEYEKCIAAEPSVSNLCAFGKSLSMVGDVREKKVWERVLKKDQSCWYAYHYLAEEALRSNKINKALKLARKAESLEPLNADVLFELGRIYHASEQFPKAIEYYSKADKNGYQEKGPLYAGLANCFLEISDKNEASLYIRKAIEISPENDYVQMILEEVEKQLEG